MKLFNNLSSDQQNSAVHECIHRIIDSMVEDGSPIVNPSTDDEKKLDIELKAAIETLRQMENGEEQVEYVMNNEAIKDIVMQLSVELAKGSFIAEVSDSIIFLDDEDDKEHMHDDEGGCNHSHQDDKKELN